MQALIERIRNEGVYLGNGVLKVDGFLNHQVDARLALAMGAEFVQRFERAGVRGVSKVITAEVSGIAPALATAHALAVPLIYARKHRSSVMTDVYYLARATSRTRAHEVDLMISRNYLSSRDHVLVIDDFLATGSTIRALCELLRAGGASLAGIGCVIEKPAEGGRDRLAELEVPVEALATVAFRDGAVVVG